MLAVEFILRIFRVRGTVEEAQFQFELPVVER
jgi:hypothetical protein